VVFSFLLYLFLNLLFLQIQYHSRCVGIGGEASATWSADGERQVCQGSSGDCPAENHHQSQSESSGRKEAGGGQAAVPEATAAHSEPALSRWKEKGNVSEEDPQTKRAKDWRLFDLQWEGCVLLFLMNEQEERKK
jgi:hypothetical protein